MTDDTAPSTPRGELLDEAKHLITGDRNLSYGTPTQNFENIAKMWTVQLQHLLKDGVELEARHVADLMILLKVARSIAQPKRDNYVDIAGYAACGWEASESAEDQPVSAPAESYGVHRIQAGTIPTPPRETAFPPLNRDIPLS